MMNFRLPVARWLANEVADLLASDDLTSDLFIECSSNPSPRLSPAQEQLVGVVCRLPDLLANRLGRSLPAMLLPAEYFRLVGGALYKCLERVYTSIKGTVPLMHASVNYLSILLVNFMHMFQLSNYYNNRACIIPNMEVERLNLIII